MLTSIRRINKNASPSRQKGILKMSERSFIEVPLESQKLTYCISIALISKPCSSTAHVIIKVLRTVSHSKEFCPMKHEQILKKNFPPEMHTCVKELMVSEGVLFFILLIAIIIIIGLIKYLVWFMPSKLSIHVGKQNDIGHLPTQSPLFIAKRNSSFRIRLSL